MDKSIEIMMVIAVTVVAAGIVIFLVQGESSDFGDWAGNQQSSAQCELHIQQGDCTSFEEDGCPELPDFESSDCSEEDQQSQSDP